MWCSLAETLLILGELLLVKLEVMVVGRLLVIDDPRHVRILHVVALVFEGIHVAVLMLLFLRLLLELLMMLLLGC